MSRVTASPELVRSQEIIDYIQNLRAFFSTAATQWAATSNTTNVVDADRMQRFARECRSKLAYISASDKLIKPLTPAGTKISIILQDANILINSIAKDAIDISLKTDRRHGDQFKRSTKNLANTCKDVDDMLAIVEDYLFERIPKEALTSH